MVSRELDVFAVPLLYIRAWTPHRSRLPVTVFACYGQLIMIGQSFLLAGFRQRVHLQIRKAAFRKGAISLEAGQ